MMNRNDEAMENKKKQMQGKNVDAKTKWRR